MQTHGKQSFNSDIEAYMWHVSHSAVHAGVIEGPVTQLSLLADGRAGAGASEPAGGLGLAGAGSCPSKLPAEGAKYGRLLAASASRCEHWVLALGPIALETYAAMTHNQLKTTPVRMQLGFDRLCNVDCHIKPACSVPMPLPGLLQLDSLFHLSQCRQASPILKSSHAPLAMRQHHIPQVEETMAIMHSLSTCCPGWLVHFISFCFTIIPSSI